MNRINLVCLGVRDMEKSLAFYKGIGFKTQVTEQNPPLVFFNHAGTRLELYPLQNLAKDINESHPPALADGGFNGITFAINVKSEQEVDDLIALVQHHGGTRSSRNKKSTGAATAVIFAIPMAITGRLPGHPSGSLTLETG